MSMVPKETIEVIAQSIGIPNLSPGVALALAPDVEYRVREIMQEAIKCMRHSRRTSLTAADVDAALNLRNVEPIYGFASGDVLQFKKATGHKDLFYVDDKDVEFKDVIEAPLPKVLLDTAVIPHWLAVDGVQPAIPENPSVEVPLDNKKTEYKEDGLLVDIRFPVKHMLSRELQLYYEKVTELTVSRSHSVLFKEALASLSTDSGLQPLVPKFTCFIADQVQRKLSDFSLLFALMRLVWSLLQNPHIQMEPFLHQVMPSVITCLGTRRLGNRISESHWELRNFAADLVALICKRFGHAYNYLQSRVVRTLLDVFLDPTRALPQHYGAIQGLVALGPSMVHNFVLPNLELYLQLLVPEMQLEKQKNEVKKREAWRVYGALLNAAGLSVYGQIKISCNFLSPPAHAILKSNVKIVTTTSNKRKASMDNLMQQPTLKKVATDSVIPMDTMRVDVQGTTGRFPTAVGCSEVSVPSVPRQLSSENVSGSNGSREAVGARALKRSAVLALAWNEKMDAGHLLMSLFELFGESMLCFIPSNELCCFL